MKSPKSGEPAFSADKLEYTALKKWRGSRNSKKGKQKRKKQIDRGGGSGRNEKSAHVHTVSCGSSDKAIYGKF